MSVRLASAFGSAFFSIIFTNRSNRYATSCGPGLASGCPWKPNAGRSVRAIPCRLPSNSDTCVTRACAGQRRRVDGEAVVLARDQHLPGVAVEHRVVGAVVAELHLHRPRARRERQQLVAEADAERRHAGVDDRRDRADRVGAGLGVAGPVRQEHAVGRQREDRLGRRLRRHDRQPAAALGEHAQDVVLDAEVVGDHVEARRAGAGRYPSPSAQVPAVHSYGRRAAHDLREILARHRRRRPRPRDGLLDVGVARRPRGAGGSRSARPSRAAAA